MKMFNQLAKNKLLKIFLSRIKMKVVIKCPKKLFFSAENLLGAERVKTPRAFVSHKFKGYGKTMEMTAWGRCPSHKQTKCFHG